MSLPVQDELLRYMVPLTDDPEVRARQRHMARFLNERVPEVREEAVDEGLGPLMHQFERRLSRKLTDGEHRMLRERLHRLGANRLGDVVLDLSADALDVWLADPNAK